MGVIEILNAGSYACIQDGGRIGFRAYAIPSSGCLDSQLHEMANYLAGIPLTNPSIEIIGGRFVARCLAEMTIGVAGYELKVFVNNQVIDYKSTTNLRPGDELRIESKLAYLSMGGELKGKQHFGSYSSYPLAKLGTPLLQKGDRLAVTLKAGEMRTLPSDLFPIQQQSTVIRIIEGPEWNWLEVDRDNFERAEWSVLLRESNRMGIRLDGQSIPISNVEMTPVPTFPGTIQFPPNGQPIILMNDAQTTGGYPRIGQVIKADMPRMARMMLGGIFRFKFASIEEARYIFSRQQAFLHRALI